MTEEEEERFRLTGLLPRGRRWEPLDEDLDEHKTAHTVYEAWMEKEFRIFDHGDYYGTIIRGHSYTTIEMNLSLSSNLGMPSATTSDTCGQKDLRVIVNFAMLKKKSLKMKVMNRSM